MKYLIMTAVLCMLILQGCINEPPLKQPFRDFEPVALQDGWEITTPAEAGIDSAGLHDVFLDFHADEEAWQVRSLSVFRHGKIVAESYTKDASDRVTPRAVWSCTKQFTGVLAGIALERGLISSIDDPISDYLPDAIARHPDKSGITIRDLLTMRSGLDYRNYGIGGDDSQIMQQIPDNYLEFVLAKPLVDEPGTEFDYKDGDPQILSSVIQAAAGEPMDAWAQEVLLAPLGIERFEWRRYRDGATLGSFGILTTPREMAKLAQLTLDGGMAGGTAIVSGDWITEMTSPLVEAGDKHFGYQWWSYPEHGTYFMSGNGRQLVFVFPAKELIVVITSEPNLQGKFNLPTPTGRTYAQRVEALCN